jgi:hypothetical protein
MDAAENTASPFRPARDQFSLSGMRKADVFLEEHMGCSWVQFVMIMALFCSRQTGTDLMHHN